MSVNNLAGQINASSIYDRMIEGTQKAHRLFSAHWELTYRCNEQCSHCYLDVFQPNAEVPGELTTVECFRVIDELAELGAMHLLFSGGEILAHRDFFQIAEYARSKRLLLRLFTNGILITPRVADRIAALHPYAVEISVYSINPETHDNITRVPRSWELTARALGLLRDRGVRTKMKVPLMRENLYELRQLEDMAGRLGAEFRYDSTITPKDDGNLSPLRHRLTHKELVWLFHEVLAADPWVNRRVSADARTCGIGLNSLVIDPYGNIFPCVQTRELAGNVRADSLKAIWEESLVWKEMGGLTISELPVCRNCELLNLCVRCHGLAQVEDGDLRGPAFANCREAIARRQVLIEKGALPADHPVPEHLREYAARCDAEEATSRVFANFIPASALSVHRRATVEKDDRNNLF
ncbi:MAG TPA: radical SAM protein [Blastocatellia bacterium]|nr:radical SAM protein [Blastocatellia bacterium]